MANLDSGAQSLRIVSDNAADRATITASSTAGTLAASNLQTDIKTQLWRSTGTTETLTLQWASPEFVSMVSVAFANTTSVATIQVQGYTEPTDSTPSFDTGVQFANPSTLDDSFDWGGVALGSNAYSYNSAGSYATVWFATKSVKKIVITLADPTNPAGFLQAARMVAGGYWSPENNCEYGVEVTYGDMSKQERSDAGDLHTDRGPRYKILSLDVTMMPKADRNKMWRIFGANGMTYPIFFSLSPEGEDTMEEQIFQVYGKLSKLSGMKYQYLNQFNTHLDIEEI
jgi:hypothetical protein